MRAAHSITSSGSSPRSQATLTRAAADRDAVERATETFDGLLMLEQLGLV
jgi:flavin-binding protein dodecin